MDLFNNHPDPDDDVTATMADIQAYLSEQGLVAVPLEPTEEMFQAGEDCFVASYTGTPIATPDEIYKAMIKAAQGEGNE